jgi:hypothetical protein
MSFINKTSGRNHLFLPVIMLLMSYLNSCKARHTSNSNLLFKFYKTPFSGTRSLEHDERSEECFKTNKWDKIANIIFFLFCPYFKFNSFDFEECLVSFAYI